MGGQGPIKHHSEIDCGESAGYNCITRGHSRLETQKRNRLRSLHMGTNTTTLCEDFLLRMSERSRSMPPGRCYAIGLPS